MSPNLGLEKKEGVTFLLYLTSHESKTVRSNYTLLNSLIMKRDKRGSGYSSSPLDLPAIYRSRTQSYNPHQQFIPPTVSTFDNILPINSQHQQSAQLSLPPIVSPPSSSIATSMAQSLSEMDTSVSTANRNSLQRNENFRSRSNPPLQSLINQPLPPSTIVLKNNDGPSSGKSDHTSDHTSDRKSNNDRNNERNNKGE